MTTPSTTDRTTRKPRIRYSCTAATGSVAVLHGDKVIATLHRDTLWGWGADSDIAALRVDPDSGAGGARRDVLDHVARTYTRMWKAGEV